MGAHSLLESPALDPNQLTTIYSAFDAAWDEVKSSYDSDRVFAELERARLANAVLLAYRDGTTDLEALKAGAIQTIKLYRPLRRGMRNAMDDPHLNALERAFELARSGQFDRITDIKRHLRTEGYAFEVITGPYLSRQLRDLMREAKPVEF